MSGSQPEDRGSSPLGGIRQSRKDSQSAATSCKNPWFSRGFSHFCNSMRDGAAPCGTAFRSALEVVLDDLQVMLGGDALRIANPGADDVNREDGGQLHLASGAQVLEKLRPGRKPGPANDSRDMDTHVLVGVAVAGKGSRPWEIITPAWQRSQCVRFWAVRAEPLTLGWRQRLLGIERRIFSPLLPACGPGPRGSPGAGGGGQTPA
jgi:hypothetical protein